MQWSRTSVIAKDPSRRFCTLGPMCNSPYFNSKLPYTNSKPLSRGRQRITVEAYSDRLNMSEEYDDKVLLLLTGTLMSACDDETLEIISFLNVKLKEVMDLCRGFKDNDNMIVLYTPSARKSGFKLPALYSNNTPEWDVVPKSKLMNLGSADAVESYLLNLFGIDASKGCAYASYTLQGTEYFCSFRQAPDLELLLQTMSTVKVYDG